MIEPTSNAWLSGKSLRDELEERGYTRREFLSFCGEMAAVLGLASLGAPRVARALEQLLRPRVVWLQLQECTGCVESVLRSDSPTMGDLVLDLVSVDYQHTLMAAAGARAEAALAEALQSEGYLLVVTGSIPRADGGIYCTIGGRTAETVLLEAAEGAAAIVAVGACAHWGSVQAARPNPTGAVGVSNVIRDRPVVNVAGCPPIADVITGTIVHYLTFGNVPEFDADGRPLFAYGARIHDQCPRRAHFDAGQYVEEFDDEAARKGWCLYKVGCKGPATFSPCPIVQWNRATSWPIGAGHPCIGCTERHFWDTMSPFYQHLPDLPGVGGVERTADIVGVSVLTGATAGVVAHAVASGVARARERKATGTDTDPDAGEES